MKEHKRSPRGRLRPAWFVGLVALSFGAGWLAPRSFEARQEIPSELSNVSAAVRELVDRHVALVRVSPSSAEEWATLGLVYAANELWNPALPCFVRASELDPTDPVYSLHAALSYTATDDTESCRALLRDIHERFPDYAPALDHHGYVLLELGEFEEAEQMFRRLLEIEGFTSQALAGLADCALRAGDPERALGFLERAKAFPMSPSTKYIRGLALARLGREEEARADLTGQEEARRWAIPDRLSYRRAIYAVSLSAQLKEAQNHLEGGRLALAVQILEAGLERHPDDGSLKGILGSAYTKDARPYLALPLLEEAIAEFGDDPHLRVNLATVLLMVDEVEGSLAQADRALELKEDLLEAHLIRARALRRSNRMEEAYHALLAAREIDPSHRGVTTEFLILQKESRELYEQGLLQLGPQAGDDSRQ